MGKLDTHKLVSILKDLALELGRTPTSTEFFNKVIGGQSAMRKHFGTWTQMLQAAGLEKERIRKIDNSIFEKNIDKHLEAHVPLVHKEPGPFPTAAVISDIHWPFHKQSVIDKFLKYVEEKKPGFVIINGDAWDMYSHAKFPRSHNVFTPREEQAKAREFNEKFWVEVKKRSPESVCVQMMGNHDIRPLKRVMEEYPEAEDWIKEKITSLFTYDGVKTIHDPREELFISEDIAVFHGYRSQLGDHRNFTHYNCVNGHTHKGGVVFKQIRGTTLFEANSGYAGDPTAKGLTYTPQKITDWTWGFVGIDQWGPRFIPA